MQHKGVWLVGKNFDHADLVAEVAPEGAGWRWAEAIRDLAQPSAHGYHAVRIVREEIILV